MQLINKLLFILNEIYKLYIVLKLRYFQVGGTPEHVIELLSKNYIGVAQMANMVAEWLILGGIHFYLPSNIS